MKRISKTKKTTKQRKTVVDNQSFTDVYGSYTGINLYDCFDEPVQDADDL